jgi:hypothetical protein
MVLNTISHTEVDLTLGQTGHPGRKIGLLMRFVRFQLRFIRDQP